jgi:putative transposase
LLTAPPWTPQAPTTGQRSCIPAARIFTRTSNPVAAPFSAARLRTDAARRCKQVDNATAVIWQILLAAERALRRVKHPELMKGVYEGIQYSDGLQAKTKAAA